LGRLQGDNLEKLRIKLINTEGKYFEIENSPENPWNNFLQHFLTSGHQFTGKNWNNKYEVLVTNTHRWRYIFQCFLYNIDKSKRILILWEPRTTNSSVYRRLVISRYGYVFVPSREWLSGKNVKYFNWPQRPARGSDIDLPALSSRKEKAIFIAANKVSIIAGELYSLRRQVLSDERVNKLIDVAGPGWNQSSLYIYKNVAKQLIKNGHADSFKKNLSELNPRVTNHLGFIKDKNSLIQEYQVSLVIENSLDYVSEKLFDALDAGAVTVYVGGLLTNFELPPTLAIQVPPNCTKIMHEVERLLSLDIDTLKNIQKEQQFQYSKIHHTWNNMRVFHDLAVEIERTIEQH
jgi:hypothetical protein